MTAVSSPTLSAQAEPHTRFRRLRSLHEAGFAPVLVLLALTLLVSAYDWSFLQVNSILSLLEQAAPLALLAVAQAVVVLTGRIHLANAALATFAGVVLAKGLGAWGPVAIPVVLLGATLLGLVIGMLHVVTQIPSLITTLGFLGVFSGLSLWISDADSVFVQTGYSSIEWITFRIFGVPIAFALVFALTLLLIALGKALPAGRQVLAVGLNERAAAYSGIRTNRVVVLMFSLSGLLSGLAAVVAVAQLQSAGATTLDSLLLPSIAAVIVGGTALSGGVGGLGRTLCGALVIAVLRVGLDLVGLDAAFQPIAYGMIVIGAIAVTVDRRRAVTVA